MDLDQTPACGGFQKWLCKGPKHSLEVQESELLQGAFKEEARQVNFSALSPDSLL